MPLLIVVFELLDGAVDDGEVVPTHGDHLVVGGEVFEDEEMRKQVSHLGVDQYVAKDR